MKRIAIDLGSSETKICIAGCGVVLKEATCIAVEQADEGRYTVKAYGDKARALSGKTHFVITAVCVRTKHKKLLEFDKTEVKFNVLTDEFIKDYVDGGSPLDKAGSYGIQDGGLVKEYFGSYTNVVGLPVTLVKKMLEEVLQ